MCIELEDLNKNQQEAVKMTDGPVLAIAQRKVIIISMYKNVNALERP